MTLIMLVVADGGTQEGDEAATAPSYPLQALPVVAHYSLDLQPGKPRLQFGGRFHERLR